ncbi:hypothetical protein W822_21780 [Advenella kashmirensis W13003]|uniref:Uncharacterized protein n=1 Tax=Advenella kashmirensis W13003 TaxID=1424334 RepID=V8QMN3_9BURK|nr:hypothetical protein W822_21780 [Advenella kashmirensis W13003]
MDRKRKTLLMLLGYVLAFFVTIGLLSLWATTLYLK